MNSWLVAFIAVIAGASVTAGAYLYGVSTGTKLEQRAMLERALKATDSRRNVDAQVSSGNPADLCRLIGMLGDDLIECVRRVGEAKPQP